MYELQSGFRSTFSIRTAITYLGDEIRFNMDKCLYTDVILLDLHELYVTLLIIIYLFQN